jgi:hypothetical protein
MSRFEERGAEFRASAKQLVLEYMRAAGECHAGGEGIRLAQLFRSCGFDWGDYAKATSSNQQYWVVALMRELEAEGQVEQIAPSGPWRLT